MEHKFSIENTGDVCVAFGNFESMHKGHISVIRTLAEQAEKLNMKSVVVSVCNTQKKEILSTEEEKAYYIRNIGVDEFITYECEEDIQLQSFIPEVLIKQLGAKVIVTGKDEKFDNISAIAKEQDVQVIACDLVEENGIVITTDDIKLAFEVCNFEKITQLCGHPYTMIGTVEHGKALGRTVGMPTANLGVGPNKRRPPSGVYATLTRIEDETYKGLTNIGKRPSVDDDNRITIETFLLDFSKDIYGKKLIMEVQLFIRGVVKFDNLEEVQNQVQKDLDKTRRFLEHIQ
ncbi:riboflavin kinase [Lachnospiraceae bacterium LCP25S3_G4]